MNCNMVCGVVRAGSTLSPCFVLNTSTATSLYHGFCNSVRDSLLGNCLLIAILITVNRS
jgi:hypothetical protein